MAFKGRFPSANSSVIANLALGFKKTTLPLALQLKITHCFARGTTQILHCRRRLMRSRALQLQPRRLQRHETLETAVQVAAAAAAADSAAAAPIEVAVPASTAAAAAVEIFGVDCIR
jgi:hypothetical protein